MTTISLVTPAGKEIFETKFSSVDELKDQINIFIPRLSVERQSLSFVKDGKKIKLAKDDQLKGMKRVELVVKDLGPQIGWQTVFLIEYFGPILVHLLWFVRLKQPTQLQTVTMAMFVAHFVKRELETLFVHRFSHGTMPFMNVFKNSFHYWILSGLLVALEVYRSSYGKTQLTTVDQALIGLWFVAELANLKTHLTLMNLRPANSKVRKVPYGFGFDQVACPNYFFEIVGWIAVSIITGSYACWFFTVVATGQMYLWAVKKHQAYIKEFKEYPKSRKILVPYLL